MSGDLHWFKSSYSGTEGGNCLEVAACHRTVHVRDSKLGPQSPEFVVVQEAWAAFVAYARVGGS
jgi:hypothetical protein